MAYNNIFFDLVNCLEIIHSYYILLYTMLSKHFLRLIPEGIVYINYIAGDLFFATVIFIGLF